jgi:pilus assembly protein Flp/PilA
MFQFFHALRNREEGQALVEYGLILGLVSVACITTLGLLGTGINDLLNQVVQAL